MESDELKQSEFGEQPSVAAQFLTVSHSHFPAFPQAQQLESDATPLVGDVLRPLASAASLIRDDPMVRKGILLAVGTGCAQNFAFSNAVLYYGKDFLVSAGVAHAGSERCGCG